MSIGKIIKEKRLQLGYSVDDLAKKLGKNRATIYRYEKDEIENLPISILKPLAKALNTTPGELLNWESDKKHYPISNDSRQFLIKEAPSFYNVNNDTSTFMSENYYNMDEPQFLVSESKIKKISSGTNLNNQITIHAFAILENFLLLNEEGQEKLADYADDLVSSCKYKKHNPLAMGKEA